MPRSDEPLGRDERPDWEAPRLLALDVDATTAGKPLPNPTELTYSVITTAFGPS